MYKVANAERTAKVDAPSMKHAAAQFLGIPKRRIYFVDGRNVNKWFGICTEDWKETDERVAVFEIEEE